MGTQSSGGIGGDGLVSVSVRHPGKGGILDHSPDSPGRKKRSSGGSSPSTLRSQLRRWWPIAVAVVVWAAFMLWTFNRSSFRQSLLRQHQYLPGTGGDWNGSSEGKGSSDGRRRPVAPFHLACLLNPRAEGRSWGIDVYSGAASSYKAEQQLAELKDLLSRLERRVSKVEHAAVARSASEAASKGNGKSSSSSSNNSGYVRIAKTDSPLVRARATLLQHLQQVASSPGTAGKQRIPKMIHQVYGLFADLHPPWYLQTSLSSFRSKNPGWEHLLWGPLDVEDFVREHHPALWPIFQRMALPVLRADLVRYLLVYTFGGVYSDIDTKCLSPIDEWADGVANVSLIIGIEADAASDSDWSKYWGRQLQFVQWTFAGAPGHPVLANTVYRIARILAERSVEDVSTGEVTGVTGPTVFTDAVYEYMRSQGRDWHEFLGKNKAELVGDMYVLSITGFSPGVGHMGSESVGSPLARVQHLFGGSWTEKAKRQHQVPTSSAWER